MSWTPGPIRQNGYVVRDLAVAVEHWTTVMGVGPFFVVDRQPLVDFRYRGTPSELSMSIALAQSGGIQIELIQPLNDAPSAFDDFRRAHGEGLQHVAFWTEHFDDVMAEGRRRGLEVVQGGRSGSGGPHERFAYLESGGHAGTMIEISETLGRKAELFAAVAAASVGWTGDDPVRDMATLLR